MEEEADSGVDEGRGRMMELNGPEQMLSVGKVAKIFDVQPPTVRRWIISGELAATKLPGGHYRVSTKEITRYANERYGSTDAEDQPQSQ